MTKLLAKAIPSKFENPGHFCLCDVAYSIPIALKVSRIIEQLLNFIFGQ